MNPLGQSPRSPISYPDPSPKRHCHDNEIDESLTSSSSAALEQTLDTLSDISPPIVKTSFQQALEIIENQGDLTQARELMLKAALELDMQALNVLCKRQAIVQEIPEPNSSTLQQNLNIVFGHEWDWPHVKFYDDIIEVLTGDDDCIECDSLFMDDHTYQLISNVLNKVKEQFLANQRQSPPKTNYETTPIPELTLEIRNSCVYGFEKTLFEQLRSNCLLTNLVLNDCKGFADNTVEALCESLHSNTALTALSLHYFTIGNDGCSHFGKLLSTNTTLTTLKLVENNIETLGAEILSGALANNSTLTCLTIETNTIGAQGTKFLADALTQNTTLQSLSLHSTDVSIKGTGYLCDLLRINSTINSLNIAYCSIESPGALALGNMLAVNSTLTSLNIESNDINDDEPGMDRILTALLSNNPSLCSIEYDNNELTRETCITLDQCSIRNGINLGLKNTTLFALLTKNRAFAEETNEAYNSNP